LQIYLYFKDSQYIIFLLVAIFYEIL
jgi:hypothetical protein